MPSLALDRRAGASMLRALGVGDRPVTFQTFKEAAGSNPRPKIIHGHFDALADRLEEQNQRGAGVFFMVNDGDGLGRRAANVCGVRALFVDLDGAPVDPVVSASLSPHVVIETSPSRFHAYWAVKDWPLAAFTAAQKTLAARFNGDPSVSDNARVMRLAGSWHVKREPCRSRIVQLNDKPPYSRDEICLAFQIASNQTAAKNIPVPQGGRNNALFRIAAMLRNRGFPSENSLQRLLTLNATQCRPPLPESEVRQILKSAFSHPVEGSITVQRAELASEAYRRADFAARALYIEARRQYDGSNDGRISLTWNDLKDRGFANKKTLARAKRECIRAGLLAMARSASYGRSGAPRRCALYRLPLVAAKATNPESFSVQNDPPDLSFSREDSSGEIGGGPNWTRGEPQRDYFQQQGGRHSSQGADGET